MCLYYPPYFRLTRGEGPIFEMHEVVEHNHLIQMIEKVFPDMSAVMYQKIYQNLLKCVEKRDCVSICLMFDCFLFSETLCIKK